MISAASCRFYFDCPHHGLNEHVKLTANKSAVDVCPVLLLHLTLAVAAEEAQQAFEYHTFYRVCEELAKCLVKEARSVVQAHSRDDGNLWKLREAVRTYNVIDFVLGTMDYRPRDPQARSKRPVNRSWTCEA